MVAHPSSRPAGAEERLIELGITLPAQPQLFGTYAEAVQTGNLLGGHFAFDTAAEEIAALVRCFLGPSR